VTFPDGTTGTAEGENVLEDWLPPRPAGFVISEIRLVGETGTSAQFIEVYNGSTAPVDLRFWTVDGWDPSNGVRISARFPSVVVAPGCHFLLTADDRSAGVASDGWLLPELSPDGGVALRGLSGQVIDQVGFNAASIFKEGSPLPSSHERRDQSYARIADTGNNLADFAVRAPSQPQNLAQCAS
jgi:hypothetical protein